MNVLVKSANANFTKASEVVIPEIFNRRFKTNIPDLDEVFGGAGFIPGFMATIAAPAGVGKSSFCLQLLQALEDTGKKTAYISGEETIEQVSFACKRLGVHSVPIANLTDVDEIEQAVVEHKLDFIVIDSYPTISTKHDFNSREKEDYIVTRLVTLAKTHEVCVIVIMHFTKSGTFKGSSLVTHSFDSLLTIEKSEDDHELRDIIVHKNRFGSCTFTSFRFGSTGYVFEAVASNGEVEQKSKEKKASKRDVVLSALEEGEKTIADLAKETGVNGQYLVAILRDLSNEGVVSKEGKGAQAIFKKL